MVSEDRVIGSEFAAQVGQPEDGHRCDWSRFKVLRAVWFDLARRVQLRLSRSVMVSQNLRRLDYVVSWFLDVNNHIQATSRIKHDRQVQGVM